MLPAALLALAGAPAARVGDDSERPPGCAAAREPAQLLTALHEALLPPGAVAAAARRPFADAALQPLVDRLCLQDTLRRLALGAAPPPHGVALAAYDWLGFDADHTLLAYKQDAVNGALFRATARHLISHGAHNARSYSIKDSARGSLIMGANLTGNRLPQYRALLVANLLLDARLDAAAARGAASPTAVAAAAAASPGAGLSGGGGGGGGASAHLFALTTTTAPAPPAASPSAASPSSPPPQRHLHGSSHAIVDFAALLAAADDPTVCAAKAAAVPLWRHLAHTGTVLDFVRGNVLWLDAERVVTHAVHGARVLSDRQLARLYGRQPLPVLLGGSGARGGGAPKGRGSRRHAAAAAARGGGGRVAP